MIHFPTREPVTQGSFNRIWIILLIFGLVIATRTIDDDKTIHYDIVFHRTIDNQRVEE